MVGGWLVMCWVWSRRWREHQGKQQGRTCAFARGCSGRRGVCWGGGTGGGEREERAFLCDLVCCQPLTRLPYVAVMLRMSSTHRVQCVLPPPPPPAFMPPEPLNPFNPHSLAVCCRNAAHHQSSTQRVECVLPRLHTLVVVHAWHTPVLVLAVVDDVTWLVAG